MLVLGLTPEMVAVLLCEALRLGLFGVGLKDESGRLGVWLAPGARARSNLSPRMAV